VSTLAPVRPASIATVPAAVRAGRWPYAITLSYPLFWALGVPWLWGPIVTLPMLVYLFRRLPILRVPRGFGLWVLFLGWMLVTGAQLLEYGPDRLIAFVYRGSFYYSATVAFLFFFNVDRKNLPFRSLVRALAAFWVILIALGFVALVAPHGRFTSPAARLLPASVLSDKSIYLQAYPQFAQDMNIIGRPIPRPAAPYGASNVWGMNLALTTPFVLLAYRFAERRRTKLLLGGAIAAGLVPFVLSLNRGAWVAVCLGLVYAASRSLLRRGGLSKILRIAVPVVLVVGAITLTPLMGVIDARIAHGHSDEGRLAGDQEATRRVWASPIFGYGAPLPSEDNVSANHNVGTHGQIWLVMFSQGIPGLALYLGWFVVAFWRTRRARDPLELWTHTLILIAVAMMPVYGILGTGLLVLMSAIAVTLRDDDIRSGGSTHPEEVPAWP
jgi:polysaccharide biosynthesis protein PslJ